MSATNTTPNIGLPSFIGTDKPAWLTDWNGAMSTIDSEVGTLKTDLSGDETRIGNLENSVTSLNSTVSNHTTSITALNTQVGSQGGQINTINSLIGNGTPTTTDQTIIGAINEINASVSPIVGKYILKGVETYEYTPDGSETYASALKNAMDGLRAALANLADDEFVQILSVGGFGYPMAHTNPGHTWDKNNLPSGLNADLIGFGYASEYKIFGVRMDTNASSCHFVVSTFSDAGTFTTSRQDSNTATGNIAIVYNVFKAI